MDSSSNTIGAAVATTEAKPLPGPRGPLAAVRGVAAYHRDPFRFFVNIREQFGDIMRLWNLGFPLAVVYQPEMVEHLLVRNARNYTKDAYLRQWLEVFGQGLLTSEGELWKRERRLLQPTFSRDRIEAYGAEMRALAGETFDRWKPGETRDVSRDIMALTLRIVVKTIFGSNLEPGVEARVADAFGHCTRYFTFTGDPLGGWLSRFPLPVRRRYVRAVRELDRIIGGIIDRRRREEEAAAGAGPGAGAGAGAGAGDLLGMLLELRDEDGSGMSDRQLRDEIMTLFLAGHETTALSVMYSLHLFARHPAAQERARGGDRAFLKQFISESLRLYPPAWTLIREAAADDVIAGYAVPAGTNVIVPTWAIHRDPHFYPEPDEFRPERWTPEFQKGLPRAAYLPFGFGARMCIGFAFAMNEIQILLEEALRRFQFDLVDDAPLQLEASITMRPRREVRLRIDSWRGAPPSPGARPAPTAPSAG